MPCSRELALESGLLAPEVETVFLGGGTPTFTEPAALERLLAALPDAAEVTVEANPETVTRGARRAAAATPRQPGLARRAELRAPAARGARTARRAPTTSGGRSRFCVRPGSTTSPSI